MYRYPPLPPPLASEGGAEVLSEQLTSSGHGPPTGGTGSTSPPHLTRPRSNSSSEADDENRADSSTGQDKPPLKRRRVIVSCLREWNLLRRIPFGHPDCTAFQNAGSARRIVIGKCLSSWCTYAYWCEILENAHRVPNVSNAAGAVIGPIQPARKYLPTFLEALKLTLSQSVWWPNQDCFNVCRVPSTQNILWSVCRLVLCCPLVLQHP